MGSLDLFQALSDYLDVCLVALDDTPDGRPECAYLSPGPPAWDSCPCLTVYAGGPVVADTFPLQPSLSPGHRVQTYGLVDLVSLTATILRCAPLLAENGEVPTPDEFLTATRQVCADVWAIWNHVSAAKRAGTLFGPREREFFLDPAVAVNQQGGACGWQITVRTQLDGY